MYVLARGMNNRALAITFAALTAVSAFGIGNTVQANSVATMVHDHFGVSTWITGAVMTAITALVIIGGIRSIAVVCEWLVPFMAIFYVVGCSIMLVMHASTIPETIGLIVSSAFTGQAAVGGFAGAGVREAMRYGVARGLFSNESGLGSAPIVAAAAQTKNPVRQALVCSTGTFWDTVVVCAMTGLVVVNSGQWRRDCTEPPSRRRLSTTCRSSGRWCSRSACSRSSSRRFSGGPITVKRPASIFSAVRSVVPYRWLWVVAVMVGPSSLPVVWSVADVANASDGGAKPDLAARSGRRGRGRNRPLPLDGRHRERERGSGPARQFRSSLTRRRSP